MNLFSLGNCFSPRGIPHSTACGSVLTEKFDFAFCQEGSLAVSLAGDSILHSFLNYVYIINADSKYTCGEGLVFWFLPRDILSPHKPLVFCLACPAEPVSSSLRV